MAINQDFVETMEDSDYGFEKWLSSVIEQAVIVPVPVLGCDDNGMAHI